MFCCSHIKMYNLFQVFIFVFEFSHFFRLRAIQSLLIVSLGETLSEHLKRTKTNILFDKQNFFKWSNFPEVFHAQDPTQAVGWSFEVLQWLLLASDLPFQRYPIEFRCCVFDQAILRTGLYMHKNRSYETSIYHKIP